METTDDDDDDDDDDDGLILSFVVEPRVEAAPRTLPLGAARWIQAALPATSPHPPLDDL